MGSTRNIVLAFDAYGTLLDTYSIADQLAKHVGQTKARSISAAWRKYQLEYTWRLNSMGTCSNNTQNVRVQLTNTTRFYRQVRVV